MKRMLAITLVLTLVLALALPGVAMAKRGGVPANGKGHSAAAAPAGDEGTQPATDKDKGKDKVKPKDESLSEDEEAAPGEESEAADEAEEPADGEEATEAPAEKLTGVANALSRLQRNLARKQAQVEAGLRDALPSGLQQTIAKFMSWLGIEPTDATDEADEADASEETSPTPVPDDTDLTDDAVDEGAPEL